MSAVSQTAVETYLMLPMAWLHELSTKTVKIAQIFSELSLLRHFAI
jgi:hypothetical protein